MSKLAKVVMMDPNTLRVVFDVRAKLDEDRVVYFGELYEAGVELPALIVTADLAIVEGRHRREGAILVGKKEVPVVITHEQDPVKLVGMAYRANDNGALPPTREDIEHTISTLLGLKVSHAAIAEELRLPKSIVRRYITNIRSGEAHARMRRATRAVVDDGMTVTKAAEEHGVDPDKLKNQLGGNVRRRRSSVDQIKAQFTGAQRSSSKSIGERVKRLIEEYEDGEMSEKGVLEILDHLEHLNTQARKRLIDWRMRFDAARGYVPVVTENPVSDSSSKKKKQGKGASSASAGKKRSGSNAGSVALGKMGLGK